MISAEAAADIIGKRCPGWPVHSIDYIGEGDFCIAYLVNNEWVFRFAKHEKAAASLMREACLLPLIASRFDVRIPSPQLVHADSAPAFMGYPMLPGPALTRERYLLLPELERARCAHQLAVFLGQMHSTDLSLVGRCGVIAVDYVAQYGGLPARARKHLSVKLTPSEQAFVEQSVNDYLASQTPPAFKPVLLHGDLSPDHVLYNERASAVTAVIDFGDMVLGDPAWDLMLIYEDYGLDFLSRLLRTYRPDDVRAVLERVYSLYVLGAIEWAVEKSERKSPEFDEALAQLRSLKTGGARQLQELLSACSAI